MHELLFPYYKNVTILCNRLTLFSLDLFSRQEDLRRPFEQFGPVKDIYLPRDYYTGWACSALNVWTSGAYFYFTSIRLGVFIIVFSCFVNHFLWVLRVIICSSWIDWIYKNFLKCLCQTCPVVYPIFWKSHLEPWNVFLSTLEFSAWVSIVHLKLRPLRVTLGKEYSDMFHVQSHFECVY